MKKTILSIFNFSIFSFLLAACTMGGYETGDGPNSYLQSSFGQLQTNSEAQVASMLLDDGSSVTLSEKKSLESAKADTVYRGLIYYSTAGKETKLVGFSPALVCTLLDKPKIKEFIQDPVDIESAWISKDGSYLNLTLLAKIGAISDDSKMALALAFAKRRKMADGNYHYYLSLYHDQSTVPEYYTDKTYLSLPLTTIQQGDSITIDWTAKNGNPVQKSLLY